MKNSRNDLPYKKYDEMGGIEEAFIRLGSKNNSLFKISREIGYSRETVRQDMIKYFGKKVYLEMIKNRRRTKVIAEVELELEDAIESLEKHLDMNEKGIKCILAILVKIKKSGIPLMAIIRQSFEHRKFIMLKDLNGRTVTVHTAFASGNLPEHSFGFHRFKPRKVDTDFYIFGICSEKGNTAYVFDFKVIRGLQSINLSFDRHARQSKYDYARDRWDIMF